MGLQPKADFRLLPVTALACVRDAEYLLAASGPHLDLYHYGKLETIWSAQIFQSQAIHGITLIRVSDDGTLAIIPASLALAEIVNFSAGCLLTYDGSESSLSIGPITICHDWIVHCEFENYVLQNASGTCIAAAVTAHNALITLEVVGATTVNSVIPKSRARAVQHSDLHLRPSIEQRILCAGSRCILYSAHVRWISPSHILVAAGTAFGTVIVWSYLSRELPSPTTEPSSHVLTHHVFVAHEDGAVFGVNILRPTHQSSSSQMIATCSDDRTVKIWEIVNPLKEESKQHITNDHRDGGQTASLPRIETGQGSADINAAPSCYARSFPGETSNRCGHISRVWKVSMAPSISRISAGNSLFFIISVGEDATCQVWDLQRIRSETGDDFVGQLVHVATHTNHSGKNIWSCVVFEDCRGDTQCITGGADGAIAVTNLGRPRRFTDPKDILRESDACIDNDASNLCFQNATSLSQSHRPFQSAKPKAYSFIDGDTLLATTIEGKVLWGTFLLDGEAKQIKAEDFAQGPSRIRWECIGEHADLKNYSIVVGLSHLRVGFIAGSSGKIYFCHGKKCTLAPIPHLEGKVGNLFAQQVLNSTPAATTKSNFINAEEDHNVVVLTTRLGFTWSRLYLLTARVVDDSCISVVPSFSSHTGSKVTENLDIDLPSSFVVTSMLYVSGKHNVHMLFLGSRDGKVARYRVALGAIESDADGTERQHSGGSSERISLQCLFAFHSDAVTSMQWETSEINVVNHLYGFLLTTGRDSTYAIHRYVMSDSRKPPIAVHRVMLPFGPNIEGSYYDIRTGSLRFYGFRSQDFVVSDEELYKDVLTVTCGGAHRTWAFSHAQEPKSNGDISFCWTRASRFDFHRSKHVGSRFIRRGGHGREIKSCAISPNTGQGEKGDSYLIATGAEDTEIRLFEYLTLGPRSKAEFQCVGILRKHDTGIQHLKWSKNGNFLFSSGGREELFVWRIHQVPFVRVGVVCISKMPTLSELPDLRVMGFDVKNSERVSNLGGAGDLSEFLVTVAFSDSTIRIYRFTEGLEKPAWELIHSAKYGESCLTVAEGVTCLLKSSLRGLIALDITISASTDGSIILLDSTLEKTPDEVQPQEIAVKYYKRIHQSTIKCLEVLPFTHVEDLFQSFLIVTGGDDNSLAFSHLRIGLAPQSEKTSLLSFEMKSTIVPRAHAAAITAIAVLPAEAQRNFDLRGISKESTVPSSLRARIVTSSNDQRLKVWDVKVEDSTQIAPPIKITMVADRPSAVADASALAVLPQDRSGDWAARERRVVICGVGMEIWPIPAL